MTQNDQDILMALLKYDHHCTDVLLTQAESVSNADLFREFPIGHRTLHASVHHLVEVAEKWTDRSRPQPAGLAGEVYSDALASPLAAFHDRYDAAARQMIDNAIALQHVPEPHRDAAWLIKRNYLIHITTHGTHHRAQIINMLTRLGVKDLIEGGDFGGWANAPLKRRLRQ